MFASRNHVESAGDPCMYITAAFLERTYTLSASSDSDGHEALAHRGWYLPVSQLVC